MSGDVADLARGRWTYPAGPCAICERIIDTGPAVRDIIAGRVDYRHPTCHPTRRPGAAR